MCLIFNKFGTQNKSNMLIINILLELMTLTQNYKFAKFRSKTEMCSNFYEMWRQSKWKMLIMNIVLGIDDLDPNLQIRPNLVPKLKCAPVLMEFGTQYIFKFLLIRQTYNTETAGPFLRCSLRKNAEIPGLFKQEYSQWRVT